MHEYPQYIVIKTLSICHKITFTFFARFGCIAYTLHWMKLRFGYSPYVYPIPVERDVMIGLKSAI